MLILIILDIKMSFNYLCLRYRCMLVFQITVQSAYNEVVGATELICYFQELVIGVILK